MQALAARTPAVFLPRPQLSGLAGIVQQTVTPAPPLQPSQSAGVPSEGRAPAARPGVQPPQPFCGLFGPAPTSEALQPAPQQVPAAAHQHFSMLFVHSISSEKQHCVRGQSLLFARTPGAACCRSNSSAVHNVFSDLAVS